jgi:hypothetical protein
MSLKLEGRIASVIGGSSGIVFASEGAQVAITGAQAG